MAPPGNKCDGGSWRKLDFFNEFHISPVPDMQNIFIFLAIWNISSSESGNTWPLLNNPTLNRVIISAKQTFAKEGWLLGEYQPVVVGVVTVKKFEAAWSKMLETQHDDFSKKPKSTSHLTDQFQQKANKVSKSIR